MIILPLSILKEHLILIRVESLLRIQYPDAWYHVMNRGRRGEEIFTGKNDYNVKIAAYCLMSNHYHLLVQTPDANM